MMAIYRDEDRFIDRYGPGPYAIFGECIYEALAKAAVNPDVYLFAPEKLPWSMTSKWETVEFPTLTEK